MGLEFAVLDYIQTLHNPVLDQIMTFVTTLGNGGLVWIIMTVAYLIRPRVRRNGIILCCALVANLVICNMFLKPMIGRTRPYDINKTVKLIVARQKDFSFPSGHTSVSFAMVTALRLANEKGWIVGIALGLAVLIALSRLYLYMHFPSDILGGILSGSAAGVIGYLIANSLFLK